MSITEKQLDEIRERLDAATPGPWMPDNDELPADRTKYVTDIRETS